MYNHQLRIHGEYLARTQALPKNTKIIGNGGGQRAGSLMGSAEIIMQAASTVTLSASKTITLFLEDSNDNLAFAVSPVFFKLPEKATARSWAKGDIIGRLPLTSDCRRFARVVLETDDTAVTGSVDITFNYLPR